jgi:uncharacterized membrane protein YozB (DUF420 family)
MDKNIEVTDFFIVCKMFCILGTQRFSCKRNVSMHYLFCHSVSFLTTVVLDIYINYLIVSVSLSFSFNLLNFTSYLFQPGLFQYIFVGYSFYGFNLYMVLTCKERLGLGFRPI